MKMKQIGLTLFFVFGVVLLASSQSTPNVTQTSTKAATNTAALVGNWQGTYQGAASGKCELVFAQEGSGKTTGQIAIQPDGGEKSPYMSLSSVNLEGNSLKAIFMDPDGSKIEMDGTLENSQLKGTWRTANGEGGTWQTNKTK